MGAAPRTSGGIRRVVVVVFDGVRFLDVVGPLEVFAVVNEQGDHYALEVASRGGRDVRTTTGNRLGADLDLDAVTEPIDTLVVAGSPDWSLLLEPDLVAGSARLGALARRTASVCTGTFALAAAGLLDGRRAATHWRHAAALQQRFPAVTVDPTALFVRDGPVYSSAGIASGIDLSLALVEEDLGADAARAAAKVLVVFMQRPGGQSQFSAWTTAGPVRSEPLRRLLDVVTADPAGDHTLATMAERAGFSTRHLSRLFEEQLGVSAAAYVERVRVEAARSALETGDEVLDVIAKRAGFRSVETLRRAFIRELGVSPSGYRDRFRTTGMHAPSSGATPFRVSVSPPAGS